MRAHGSAPDDELLGEVGEKYEPATSPKSKNTGTTFALPLSVEAQGWLRR
jgi:hypothetical protein